MSTLIAIVYPSEQKAEEVRRVVFDLAKRYLIKFSDLVIAPRDDKGQVKLNQLMNTTASGAAGGSFWGLLIGMIFLNPLLGAAAGAAGGARPQVRREEGHGPGALHLQGDRREARRANLGRVRGREVDSVHRGSAAANS